MIPAKQRTGFDTALVCLVFGVSASLMIWAVCSAENENAESRLIREMATISDGLDTSDWGQRLDLIREYPPMSARTTRMLIDTLHSRLVLHQSKVFRNRPSNEVVQLRTHALLVIGELGGIEQVMPAVLEEMSTSQDPLSYAAALRLMSDRMDADPTLQSWLDRGLRPRFVDRPVSFSRFQASTEMTSAVLEARSILAKSGCCRVHAETTAAIGNPQTVSPRLRDLCRTPWIPQMVRRKHWGAGVDILMPSKTICRLDDMVNRPTAIAYFYTRCHNPDRCSKTVNGLNELNAVVQVRGIANRVRLIGLSLEPWEDGPSELKKFSETRGLAVTGNESSFLARLRPEQCLSFFESCNVPVNYCDGWVNTHGLALDIYDSSGRFVRRYHSIHWSPHDVAEDLVQLLGEVATSE